MQKVLAQCEPIYKIKNIVNFNCTFMELPTRAFPLITKQISISKKYVVLRHGVLNDHFCGGFFSPTGLCFVFCRLPFFSWDHPHLYDET